MSKERERKKERKRVGETPRVSSFFLSIPQDLHTISVQPPVCLLCVRVRAQDREKGVEVSLSSFSLILFSRSLSLSIVILRSFSRPSLLLTLSLSSPLCLFIQPGCKEQKTDRERKGEAHTLSHRQSHPHSISFNYNP